MFNNSSSHRRQLLGNLALAPALAALAAALARVGPEGEAGADEVLVNY